METVWSIYQVDGVKIRQLFVVVGGIKHHLIANFPWSLIRQTTRKPRMALRKSTYMFNLKPIKNGKRRFNKS